MNIFKGGKLSFTQAVIFKISMIFAGIAFATTWPEFFLNFKIIAWIIAIVGGIYIKWVWYK